MQVHINLHMRADARSTLNSEVPVHASTVLSGVIAGWASGCSEARADEMTQKM